MSKSLISLFAVLISFGVLSALALMDVGVLGILEPHFRTWGGGQVFADLVILAVLSCFAMVRDARERKVTVWPFIVMTLLAGSFGPLLYLVMREGRRKED